MKIISIMLLSFFSMSAFSAGAWVGNVPVKLIQYVKVGSSCGSNGGECMIIVFEDGATGCSSKSISLSDTHIKRIEALALVSLTAGKNFKVWTDTTLCTQKEGGINDIAIY